MVEDVVVVPERSLQQRRDALERANRVRSARKELKVELRERRVDVRSLLLEPPEFAGSMKVFDLLLATPSYGRVKATKLLSWCRISSSKTLDGLSDRQREELVALVAGRVPPLARRPVQVGAIHALQVGGAQLDRGVLSACGRVVPSDRATLLPRAVSCQSCRDARGLR